MPSIVTSRYCIRDIECNIQDIESIVYDIKEKSITDQINIYSENDKYLFVICERFIRNLWKIYS